ncbi:hypothetical protein BX600DRAFT_121529 [Xylariales sp. PMI_506]|nr:hypothetical protein BX600DRAFT_121529 [Xylariales sp. PMI_506]
MAPRATMKATSEEKRCRRRRQLCTVPQRGSLWDIMHDHQGISLFVLPICWTDLHTRLLGCRFTSLSPQPTQYLTPPHTYSSTLYGLERDISTIVSLETPRNILTKTRALRSIMSTLFPTHLSKPKSGAELDLRFGKRLYPKAARVQVLWKHPDATMSFDSATTWTSSRSTSQLMASMHVNTGSDAPILAYVSRSNLDHIRRNCFRIIGGPNKSYNWPVHRLQSLRSKNLIPSNPDEDPYFLAVIIALAQQAVYTDVSKSNIISPRTVKVRILTTAEEDEAFIVYTATVPAAFLMMFHEPDKAPAGDAEIKVDYTQVPLRPVLGLKERLGDVLGREVVGDFDPLNIDTFPDNEEDEDILNVTETTPKRRRDVLSEVFNASFSEDRESSSGDIIRKRRCLEEGRVGVVR